MTFFDRKNTGLAKPKDKNQRIYIQQSFLSIQQSAQNGAATFNHAAKY
jgi:hypothetical protein